MYISSVDVQVVMNSTQFFALVLVRVSVDLLPWFVAAGVAANIKQKVRLKQVLPGGATYL